MKLPKHHKRARTKMPGCSTHKHMHKHTNTHMPYTHTTHTNTHTYHTHTKPVTIHVHMLAHAQIVPPGSLVVKVELEANEILQPFLTTRRASGPEMHGLEKREREVLERESVP